MFNMYMVIEKVVRPMLIDIMWFIVCTIYLIDKMGFYIVEFCKINFAVVEN